MSTSALHSIFSKEQKYVCRTAAVLLLCSALPSALLLLCFLVPKWLKIDHKIAPFWSKSGSNIDLKSVLEPTWGVERSVQAAFGLLAASWSALGGLQGPKKVIGNGSWTAQGRQGDWFQRSWGPRGSQKGVQNGTKIELRRRLELKVAKSQKSCTVHRICLIFDPRASL